MDGVPGLPTSARVLDEPVPHAFVPLTDKLPLINPAGISMVIAVPVLV